MASTDHTQQQLLAPLTPTTPKPHVRQTPIRRSTDSSTISNTPSLSTSVTSGSSTPISTITYQIRKRILTGPLSLLPDQLISIHRCLEEANNTVYAMRLAYETCDPCFFWYGDGHGSVHPDLIDPSTVSKEAAAEKRGDCLSWEVFTDEDVDEDCEDREMGCRVWVEKVERDFWGVEGENGDENVAVAESEKEHEMSIGKKVHNWREALEPIARPCDFWGTFKVK